MIPKLITRQNLTDDCCKNHFSQACFSSVHLPLLAFLCKQPAITLCSPDPAALLGDFRQKCPDPGRLDI